MLEHCFPLAPPFLGGRFSIVSYITVRPLRRDRALYGLIHFTHGDRSPAFLGPDFSFLVERSWTATSRINPIEC
jgi:hypothetical protein